MPTNLIAAPGSIEDAHSRSTITRTDVPTNAPLLIAHKYKKQILLKSGNSYGRPSKDEQVQSLGNRKRETGVVIATIDEKKIEPMSELVFDQQDPVYFAPPAPKLVCGADDFIDEYEDGDFRQKLRPQQEIRSALPRWLRIFFCGGMDEERLNAGLEMDRRISTRNYIGSRRLSPEGQ